MKFKINKKYQLMIMGLLVVGGLIFFLRYPKLYVNEIIYENNYFVTDAKLQEVFEGFENKNIFSMYLYFNFWQNHRFLARYPKLSNIKLAIKWPQTLIVQVQEKKPYFLFLGRNHNYFLAKDGTILSRKDSLIKEADSLNKLVIIRGIKDSYFSGAALEKNFFKKIVNISENLQFYFEDIDLQIEFISDDEIVLLKNDILPIKIGKMKDIEKKFKNLKYFLKYYEKDISFLEYIDLRVINKVVVKKYE